MLLSMATCLYLVRVRERIRDRVRVRVRVWVRVRVGVRVRGTPHSATLLLSHELIANLRITNVLAC